MPETSKHRLGSLLGALGLSSRGLAAVALLALLIWWYFYDQGMALNTTETAVVVLALALAVAACRAVWTALRHGRRGSRGKSGGTPE